MGDKDFSVSRYGILPYLFRMLGLILIPNPTTMSFLNLFLAYFNLSRIK